LYPATFRAEYGEEMAAIFAARLRDAAGPLARLVVLVATIPEVLFNACAVHWDIARRDVSYTLRTLYHARGFALTAILIVGLGVGANTAAFTVTDFVLFRPLPFPDAHRLVTIWQAAPGYLRMELAPGNIRDWKQAATSYEGIGIHRGFGANLLGPSGPARVTGRSISADLFPTLGVQAALGRVFAVGEDSGNAPLTVVLSDRLWRAAFGADPGVIGRKVILDEESYQVIGVMPRGFSFPDRESEVWVPLILTSEDSQDRTNNEFYAVARLKPGVSLDNARAEMALLAAQSRKQHPKENENTGAIVNDLRDDMSQQSRVLIMALSGAAFCVLLIACANLANLQLARALARRQELAVRVALGASPSRLVRQLATESIVVATLGGALGVLMATVTVPLLWRLVPVVLPTDASPAVDLRVLLYAFVLTAATAVGFSLLPMMRTRDDADVRGLRESGRSGGGRRAKLRGALVVAEVVASVVLLTGTGLLVRALWTIQATDPGFRAEGVLTLRTDITGKYVVTARRAELYVQVLDRIRAIPDVENAAYISGLPMVWGGGIWPVGINGVELERRQNNTASMRFTTPGFFDTMSVPIRAGRDVSDSDTAKTEMVALVSESFVNRYWPGKDALGRRFNFAGYDRTIVGVVGNIRVRGLERSSEPQVYLPHRQMPDGRLWGYVPKEVVIRATTPLDLLVPQVRSIIREADPQLPISDVRAMTEIVDLQTSTRTVQVQVLTTFALIALLLAATGIHGVLSFAVSQRTAEIGVRVAMGAQRRDILSLVIKQGAVLVGAGLLPGLLLAYFAGRSLQSLLIGVSPGDPRTFAVAGIVTVGMALSGMILPTLRALRVDPIKAIRAE
jgi:predicted permease